MWVGCQQDGGGNAVSRSFPRELAALEELFAFVDSFATGQELAPRDAFVLRLTVEELFTNAVRHGGGTSDVAVTLKRRDRAVILELVDPETAGFDPSDVPVVEIGAPAAGRRPGGLGLHLVRELVERLDFDFADGRMTVTAVRSLEHDDV